MHLLSLISYVGSFLTGAVLLFSGTAKALDPPNFVRHLEGFRAFPRRWLFPLTLTLSSLQSFLGTALLLHLWPRWILPASILLLLSLAPLGYWAVRTGRTGDCGCYNGIITLSPLQSLVLDGCYILLLIPGLYTGNASTPPERWRVAALAGIVLGTIVLAFSSFLYFSRRGRDLIDFSLIRPGRPWRVSWLGPQVSELLAPGEKLLVLMGETCGTCKRIVPFLNTFHKIRAMPDVVGAVGLAGTSLDTFCERISPQFPVLAAEPWRMARLMRGRTPTYVLLQDGVIREKWSGSFPAPLVGRFKAEAERIRRSRRGQTTEE